MPSTNAIICFVVFMQSEAPKTKQPPQQQQQTSANDQNICTYSILNEVYYVLINKLAYELYEIRCLAIN